MSTRLRAKSSSRAQTENTARQNEEAEPARVSASQANVQKPPKPRNSSVSNKKRAALNESVHNNPQSVAHVVTASSLYSGNASQTATPSPVPSSLGSQSTSSITPAQRPIRNHKQLEELITEAENGVFSDVVFLIGGKEKNYSPVYHWFSSRRDFERKPDGNVLFSCIICHAALQVPLGKTGNLIKHASAQHADFKLWYQRYEATKANSNSLKLDEKNLNFIKFFLTSSIALEAINNSYLRKCLSFKAPSAKTFKNVYLPGVFSTLQDAINERLRVARCITLVADIWTSKANNDFLGLAGMLIYSNARKESLVLGMERMPGKHNAENIKVTIESIIANYKFNASKITAVVTDEGSNFLRLFKKLDNSNETLFIESDSVDEEFNEDYELEESSEATEGAEDDQLDHQEFSTSPLYDDETEVDSILNQEFVRLRRRDQVVHVQAYTLLQEELEYEPMRGEIFSDLSLKIGNNDITRHSCSAHKMNIAVRKAIRESSHFLKLLGDLSRFAKSISMSIEKSQRHSSKKAKIKRETATRWSSSFMMLEAFIVSFDRNVFNDNHVCPYTRDEIYAYLLILKPVQLFTTLIQSNQVSICDVLPMLLYLIHDELELFELDDPNQDAFRNHLIGFIKAKFSHELQSKLYHVAAIMNVQAVSGWRGRSFGKQRFKFATESIVEVFEELKMKVLDEDDSSVSSSESSAFSELSLGSQRSGHQQSQLSSQQSQLTGQPTSQQSQLTGQPTSQQSQFSSQRSQPPGQQQSSLLNYFKLTTRSSASDDETSVSPTKLNEEVSKFLVQLNNIGTQTTFSFWSQSKLFNLKRLALRLLCTPASSADIERFFSVSGYLSSGRFINLGDEVLKMRSILKANIRILENLKPDYC